MFARFTRLLRPTRNLAHAHTRTMSMLFPPIKPYKTELLPVSDLHKISVRQYGRQDGQPVLMVHGGPGGGCDDKDAQRFDPDVYRVILVDQRGSGESLPAAELKENTTWDLVEDFEKVRKHLGIEQKWHVFGGSWGSTLSLAYAQTHPDRVKSLTLRGIFTLRREELRFFYQGPGTSFLFPEYWEEYVDVIPEEERSDMISAYYKRLTSTDDAVRAKAGRAWSRWEMATSRLHLSKEYLDKADDADFADKFARIEAHYFVNNGFMQDGQLLLRENIDKIRNIPAVIIQGRYDCVCPAKTAWDLHKVWPEAEYIVVPDAGHSAMEQGIEKALIDATNKFAKLA
ncbi:Proline iminopeptidase [Rhodotorula toruloides]|nr:Proline iminopeptidase [Rhodotorula toruloides]